ATHRALRKPITHPEIRLVPWRVRQLATRGAKAVACDFGLRPRVAGARRESRREHPDRFELEPMTLALANLSIETLRVGFRDIRATNPKGRSRHTESLLQDIGLRASFERPVLGQRGCETIFKVLSRHGRFEPLCVARVHGEPWPGNDDEADARRGQGIR